MTAKTKSVRLKWILRTGFCLAMIAAMVLIGAVMVGATFEEYGIVFAENQDGTCRVIGVDGEHMPEFIPGRLSIPSYADGMIVTEIDNLDPVEGMSK